MLSIVEIQNKAFKKNKIGGYNVEEVNEFLDQVVKSYQEVQNENYALKDKVNVLNESVQYYRTMESTIQNVLVLADKTAQDTKAAAYDKAEQIKKEAEARADKITSLAEERVAKVIDQGRQEAYELAQKVEEAKRQYLAYKAHFKQLLQAQTDFLSQGDERINSMQEDLAVAFERIQEDTVVKEEKVLEEAAPSEEVVKAPEGQEEAAFFTKEYVPLGDD